MKYFHVKELQEIYYVISYWFFDESLLWICNIENIIYRISRGKGGLWLAQRSHICYCHCTAASEMTFQILLWSYGIHSAWETLQYCECSIFAVSSNVCEDRLIDFRTWRSMLVCMTCVSVSHVSLDEMHESLNWILSRYSNFSEHVPFIYTAFWWYGNVLDCWPTGRAIDPAPGHD